MRRVTAATLYAASLLLALYGVTLLLGVGGDNGRRADSIEIGGRHIGTYSAGAVGREEPLEVGERIMIGSRTGIVRVVEPLLGERELRLVVQLTRDEFGR